MLSSSLAVDLRSVITRRHHLSTMGTTSPIAPSLVSRHIAVIGAGAAGIVAARELRRESHMVAVFERSNSVGGTWVYSPRTESDAMGQDPCREIVHTSLYDSLRTNLPRECMGFLDYPFVERKAGDGRRFPGHGEVLDYLERFAKEFGVEEVVRFEKEVVEVELGGDGKWVVRSRGVDGGGGGEDEEVYDGVVVCNGHYTEPRVAEIPGVDTWPGKQIHSHNYRVPDPFADQVVVLIGSSASAFDISRDVSRFAREVHIASRSEDPMGTPRLQPGYDNMWIHTMIERADEDGKIVFQDGTIVHVDVILHCTGYKYHFPFLKTGGFITVDDNRVGALYKHIFPPKLAPGLSFIGLPWKVIPFPMLELQSKWVAAVLSGRVSLPVYEQMMDDVENSYAEMEASGYPKRYTHCLSGVQFEYDDWLAARCGHPAVEEWRKQMYVATSKNRLIRPENYRDVWDDDYLIEQAHKDFRMLESFRKA